MQKRAIGPVGLALTALGGHVGTNLLNRATHHGSNLAEMLAHLGFQHGQLGQKINGGRQFALKALLGPEIMVQYELAHRVGQAAVSGPAANPEVRKQLLHQFLTHADNMKLEDVALLGPIAKAVRHEFHGTTPTFEASGLLNKGYGQLVNTLTKQVDTGFETLPQKLVSTAKGLAPLAIGAVEHGVAGHVGWNLTREGLGQTGWGQRLVKGVLREGLSGKAPRPLTSVVSDVVASPLFLEPQRMGAQIHARLAPENQRKLTEAMDHPFMKALMGSRLPRRNREHPLESLMGVSTQEAASRWTNRAAEQIGHVGERVTGRPLSPVTHAQEPFHWNEGTSLAPNSATLRVQHESPVAAVNRRVNAWVDRQLPRAIDAVPNAGEAVVEGGARLLHKLPGPAAVGRVVQPINRRMGF